MKVYQCDRCKKIYERRRLVNGEPYITHLHFIDAINNAPTVEPTFGLFKEMLCEECGKRPHGEWIPVSERLPENAKHKGAFCPKYYVMTEFGQTEGWYNPDKGCWYVLLWFMDARFETWNISLERGDVPKLVKNVPVTAWMPLPEPYKEVEE